MYDEYRVVASSANDSAIELDVCNWENLHTFPKMKTIFGQISSTYDRVRLLDILHPNLRLQKLKLCLEREREIELVTVCFLSIVFASNTFWSMSNERKTISRITDVFEKDEKRNSTNHHRKDCVLNKDNDMICVPLFSMYSIGFVDVEGEVLVVASLEQA